MVCMVGSTRPRTVDIRVVAATKKDLLSLIRKECSGKIFTFASTSSRSTCLLCASGERCFTADPSFCRPFCGGTGKPGIRVF